MVSYPNQQGNRQRFWVSAQQSTCVPRARDLVLSGRPNVVNFLNEQHCVESCRGAAGRLVSRAAAVPRVLLALPLPVAAAAALSALAGGAGAGPSGTGLVGLDVSLLRPGSQVLLLLVIIAGGPVLSSVAMPLTRWRREVCANAQCPHCL